MAGHHDPFLVAMSILLAVLSSYVALQLAGRVTPSVGRLRPVWLLGGSVAMGLGIWSMHFTAMLAYRLPVPIRYDVPLWLLSIVIAMAASLLALLVVSRKEVGGTALLVAGVIMGAAISGMHYTGMAAIRLRGRLEYDPLLVGASLAIAVGAAVAALWLLLHFRHRPGRLATWGKVGSAHVMGLAISGLHYTGMAAVRYVPGEEIGGSWLPLLSTDGLAPAVIVGTLILLALAVVAEVLDRQVQTVTEAAETARDRAAAALEASTDGIAILDAEGSFIHLNGAYAEIHGYDDPAEMIGCSWSSVYDEAEARRFEDEVHPALDRTGRWRGEAVGRKRDGLTFPQEVSVALMPAGGAVCVVRDIGVRMARERERRALEARLGDAERMESLGRLAGGIAHDFNNILLVFSGRLELLKAELVGVDGVEEELRELSRAADQATRLVQQILAFSRNQILAPRSIDLNECVRDLMPMIERLVGSEVRVEFTGDPQLERTYADPGQIERVVVNLAVNARDAMADGGTIRIRTANVARPAAAVLDGSDPSVAQDGYVRLEVEDTGVGMSPEVASRVFEPFFTTKKKGAGTGLGLATVHGIVKQTGGFVGVESRPGEGSTFSVYLPRSPAPAPSAPSLPAGGRPRR